MEETSIPILEFRPKLTLFRRSLGTTLHKERVFCISEQGAV